MQPLKHGKHLHLADPAIPVGVDLSDRVPESHIVLGRTHPHSEAEVPIPIIELLSFERP